MCGRYRVIKDGKVYWRFFKGGRGKTGRWIWEDTETGEQFDPLIKWPSRPEIKPTQQVPIFRLIGGEPQLDLACWWLLAPWAGDHVVWTRTKKEGQKYFRWKTNTPPNRKTHFNSKKTTLLRQRDGFYRQMLESNRCVLPADGFVEWPDTDLGPAGPGKLFTLKDEAPYMFPGIWFEGMDDEGNPFLTANIITVDPNDLLLALPHKRMPAILRTPAEVMAYLTAPSAEAAGEILQTTPAHHMEVTAWVSAKA